MTKIKTPCIGVCSTVFGDTVCRGCKRYLHEIIRWNGLDEQQKQAVDARLELLLVPLLRTRFELFDENRLRAGLQLQGVYFAQHRQSICWIIDLLRAGASQVVDTEAYGFRIVHGYRDRSLRELLQEIDSEFFILSQAHYDRYFGQSTIKGEESVA